LKRKTPLKSRLALFVAGLGLSLSLQAADAPKAVTQIFPSDAALAKLWRLVAERNGQQAAFEQSLSSKQKLTLESIAQMNAAVAAARDAACGGVTVLDEQGASCVAKPKAK
jgi:hypothetical protein